MNKIGTIDSEKNSLKKSGLAILAALAVVTSFTAAASATSGAHFFSDTTDSVSDTGALVVNIDEGGVGQETVNYTLTVDNATATYACINGGGNHPSASNKETVNSSLTSTFSESPINGRVMATITAGPLMPTSGFSCPKGQKQVLAQVTYKGITLTDTTNDVNITLADQCKSFNSLFPC